MGYLPSGRTITAAAQGSKRVDHPPHGPDWSVDCGPFRSPGDFESPDEAPRYSCNLAVFLDHPQVETAQYDVDVSYPGAGGQRTTSVFTFCTSDGTTASCEG
jgi:hypothetical protein